MSSLVLDHQCSFPEEQEEGLLSASSTSAMPVASSCCGVVPVYTRKCFPRQYSKGISGPRLIGKDPLMAFGASLLDSNTAVKELDSASGALFKSL